MKGGVALPKDFSHAFKSASKLLKGHKFARVISHYDADGVTAASIMIACLKSAGKDLQTTITKSLDKAMVDRIAQEGNELAIFLDMGSGQIDEIERMGSEVIILDHHKPLRESKLVEQVNPHLFGIDGTHDISASGLAFSLAVTIDEKNWNLSPLAIAGLVGDMQYLGGFSEINESIVAGAAERGIISRSNGIKLSGERLQTMISDSPNPYFRGLSGHRDATIEFLKGAGLDPSAVYNDLDDISKRRLVSLLTLKLLSQGCTRETIEQTLGEILTVTSGSLRGLKIDDVSELVNACGRLDHPGIGMALCLGDAVALNEAMKYRLDYVNSMMLELKAVEDGAFEARDHIQIIRPHRSSLAGAVCGISMQYLLDQTKPTIAISKVEGTVKVSSRGTRDLVSKGLDLAESLRKSAEPLGGVGGGHNVAAGATVPLVHEDEFLKNLDEITGIQLKKK
jgi:RecJ-like exonuclease